MASYNKAYKHDESRLLSEEKRQKQQDTYEYSKCDVLLGRDTHSFRHHGNIAFREIIKQHSDRYNKAETRRHKFIIVDEIKREIERKASFLKKNETGKWEQAPDKVVTQKISHALRDSFTKLRCNKGMTRPDGTKRPEKKVLDELKKKKQREDTEIDRKLAALPEHERERFYREKIGVSVAIRPSKRPSSPIDPKWVNFYAKSYREVDPDDLPTPTGEVENLHDITHRHDQEIREARRRMMEGLSRSYQQPQQNAASELEVKPRSRPRKKLPQDLSNLTTEEESPSIEARMSSSISDTVELSPGLAKAKPQARPKSRKPQDMSCIDPSESESSQSEANRSNYASLPPDYMRSPVTHQRSPVLNNHIFAPERTLSATHPNHLALLNGSSINSMIGAPPRFQNGYMRNFYAPRSPYQTEGPVPNLPYNVPAVYHPHRHPFEHSITKHDETSG